MTYLFQQMCLLLQMGVCSSNQNKTTSLPPQQICLPNDYIYHELHDLVLWEVRNLHIQLKDGIKVASGPISISTEWILDEHVLSKKWVLKIKDIKLHIDLDETKWQKFDHYAVKVTKSPIVLANWTFLPCVLCAVILDYVAYVQDVAIFLPDQTLNFQAVLDGVSIEERIYIMLHKITLHLTVSEFDEITGLYRTLTCIAYKYCICRIPFTPKYKFRFILIYQGFKTRYEIPISDGIIQNPCLKMLFLSYFDEIFHMTRVLSFGGNDVLSLSVY